MTYTPLTPSLPSSPRSSSSSLSLAIATTDPKDDIQKVFRYIDENNDGKISPTECGYRPAHGPSPPEQRFGSEAIEFGLDLRVAEGADWGIYTELQKCVRTVGAQELSAEEAEAIVECSDTDGDGILSLEEFENMMEVSSEEEKKEELREAFEMYKDTKGGKGVITVKSLRTMLCRLGENVSVEECKAMIRVYDLDRDGVLSFQEFLAMMT